MPMASKLIFAVATLTVSIASVTGFVPLSLGVIHEVSSPSRSVRFGPLMHPTSLCASRSRCRLFQLSMAETTIESLIEKVKSTPVASKGPDKIFRAIKKANGAPSVCVEYSREPAGQRQKVDFISLTFRRSKAAAIIVDTALPYEGGEQDFADFVKEQKTAKGNFPGPASIVWRGKIKDVDSIAKAALAGASGVALPAEELSEETLAELVHACHALDMEPFVEISDKKHVSAAVAAGARIICIRFTSNAVASFLNYAQIQLRSDIPKECAAVATIAGRQRGLEIEQAQQVLQQGKFDGVLMANFITDAADSMADRYAAYVMREVLSKRSEAFRITEVRGSGGPASAYGWGAGAGKMPPPGFSGEGTHA
uniref:indole-3-glycerol-phosphate synthase n=1 Tax=Cryptomonas curvata TaxID=233186 RepID=A0A7S0ME54_9CRYP